MGCGGFYRPMRLMFLHLASFKTQWLGKGSLSFRSHDISTVMDDYNLSCGCFIWTVFYMWYSISFFYGPSQPKSKGTWPSAKTRPRRNIWKIEPQRHGGQGFPKTQGSAKAHAWDWPHQALTAQGLERPGLQWTQGIPRWNLGLKQYNRWSDTPVLVIQGLLHMLGGLTAAHWGGGHAGTECRLVCSGIQVLKWGAWN